MKFIVIQILFLIMLPTNAISQEVIDKDLGPDTAGRIDTPDVPEIVQQSATAEVETSDIQPRVRYVSDEFFVPLRETPCARCKIVHRGIKSGTKIDLLDVKDDWGLVITLTGHKGWMPRQFIVSSPVAKNLLSVSEVENAFVRSENESLLRDIASLKQQVRELSDTVSKVEYDKDQISRRLSEVVGISSDPVALNNQNEALVKQNHVLQSNNDVLIADIEILENNRRNQSFLYGGLTVFMGALLAILIPKLRGRKKFSEWG
jgi:SH3 domain protein|tara:strand:+ start:5220 stop:6002 length:783 start_codon:yes stop_codon:yes gene_type:complete